MCAQLAPLAGRVVLVRVNSERTAAPEELAPACRAANPEVEVRCCADLPAALALTRGDPFVLVTGSLYLIGEALELLEETGSTRANERGLNEWRAAK